MGQFRGKIIRAVAIIWIAISAVLSFGLMYDSMMINTINPFNSVGDMFSIVMFIFISISTALVVSVVGFVFAGIFIQVIKKTVIDRNREKA